MDDETDLLLVNGELRVSVVLCRHTFTAAGSSRWLIRLDEGLKPDITIAMRMDFTNHGIQDYYLLPGIDMTWENLRVAEANGFYLDTYRCDSLDYFFSLMERVNLRTTMNDELKIIPLDQIRTLNPRHRDMKRFAMIVQSIKNQGLKKPIQVSERESDEGEGPTYDLSADRDASKRSRRWATTKFRRWWCASARKTGCCAAWRKIWRDEIPRRLKC